MKYLLTIYDDRSAPAEEMTGLMEAYAALGRELAESGAYIAGEGLQPVETATTVRVRGGEPMLTDGPFAETKEQLGGFYLLECRNLDEALEWAAKVPNAATGCVEVRPVMDFTQFGFEDANLTPGASR